MSENDRKPTAKVFIASSHTASDLAQKLANNLDNYESNVVELTPVRWWRRPEGSYILSTLTRQTDECDFAAVLLTEGDIDRPDRVRDNCIYEAGLFLGALGDPERCFLVVSCNPQKLPSDLAGLTYINIVEHGPEVDRTLERAAGRIGQAIEEFAKTDQLRAIRGLKLPIVSVEDLVRKERPSFCGGVLQGDTTNVFVNTPRPFEYRSEDFAKRVMSNMIEYGIDYLYVFEASRGNADIITRLLAKLASVNGVERFSTNIKNMRDSLQIHFLPDRRGLGLQYCIHNANDYNTAVCYMRTPVLGNVGLYPPASRSAINPMPEWMEWARGSQAVGIAEEITRMCIEERGKRIFRCTTYYDLYNKNEPDIINFLKTLWYELRDQCRQAKEGNLPEEDEKLLATACFGETYKEILATE
jgi:hypothetical protein